MKVTIIIKWNLAIIFSIIMSYGNIKSQTINSSTKSLVQYPQLIPEDISTDYFGTVIHDKYRFLEDVQKPKVQKWMNEEKKLTDSVFSKITFRDSILKAIANPIYSSLYQGGFPRPIENRLFFVRKFIKERIQKLLYKDGMSGNEIELFTTASMNSQTNVYNFDYFEPSYDGKYVAFGLSANGDEKTLLKVIDVEKQEVLSEAIPGTIYGYPQWIPGKKAFFYSQFKEIKSPEDEKTKYEDIKVKLHFLGSPTSQDKEIFSRVFNPKLPLGKIDLIFVALFPNSDNLIAFAAHGSSSYLSIFTTSLSNILNTEPSQVKWKTLCLLDERATNFAVKDNDFFMVSFKDNARGSLKKIDLSKNVVKAVSIKEAKEEAFEDLIINKKFLYLKSVKNSIGSFTEINPKTNASSAVNLPFQGSAYLRASLPIPPFYSNSDLFFFSMESWNRELSVYYYNPESKEIAKTKTRPESKYGEASDIITKEMEVKSYDGTMVPVSIIYSKDAQLNGNMPTLINAYGCYGSSINPRFDISILAWVRMGGIYAVAHVRGGGEKGDEWYKGGLKSTKPNSWKDLIACSEYLIASKYTSQEKLAAIGTSGGAIAVGMAAISRPELFKVIILEVGVLNPLRMENSNNTINTTEFGTSKDSLEFKYLLDMDVYHNIKENTKYPSMLITGDLKDSRVDIWQPAKGAAMFQEVSRNQNNVILFKIKESGHFGDKDKVKDIADNYSFLFWQLQHNLSSFELK